MLRIQPTGKSSMTLAPLRIDDIDPIPPRLRGVDARRIVGDFRADTIGASLAVQVLLVDDWGHAGEHVDLGARRHCRRGAEREDKHGRTQRPRSAAPVLVHLIHSFQELRV